MYTHMRQIVLIILIGLLSSTALAFSRIEPEEPEYDRHEDCEASEDAMELTKEERRYASVALGLFLNNKGLVNNTVSFTDRQEAILRKVIEKLQEK